MPTNPIPAGTCNISFNDDKEKRAELHKKAGEYGLVLSELLRASTDAAINGGRCIVNGVEITINIARVVSHKRELLALAFVAWMTFSPSTDVIRTKPRISRNVKIVRSMRPVKSRKDEYISEGGIA